MDSKENKDLAEPWNWRHIYAMLADDGRVKIGVSRNPDERAKAIENQKEIKILKILKTEKCSNPFTVEKLVHSELEESRSFGEWFCVDFEVAKQTIEKIYSKHAEFQKGKGESELSNLVMCLIGRDERDQSAVIETLADTVQFQSELLEKQSGQLDEFISTVTTLSDSLSFLAESFIKLSEKRTGGTKDGKENTIGQLRGERTE